MQPLERGWWERKLCLPLFIFTLFFLCKPRLPFDNQDSCYNCPLLENVVASPLLHLPLQLVITSWLCNKDSHIPTYRQKKPLPSRCSWAWSFICTKVQQTGQIACNQAYTATYFIGHWSFVDMCYVTDREESPRALILQPGQFGEKFFSVLKLFCTMLLYMKQGGLRSCKQSTCYCFSISSN